MSDIITMRPDGRYRDGLKNLCKYLDNYFKHQITIAEIGSYIGESTQIFLNMLCRKLKQIDCYDLWPIEQIENKFDTIYNLHKNCLESNIVNKYKMDILKDYSKVSNNYYDLIYIDADHTYESTKANIINWYTKLKENGIMGGHDYNFKYWPGVVKAVNEMFGNRNVIFFEDSSWIVGKYKELV